MRSERMSPTRQPSAFVTTSAGKLRIPSNVAHPA
jgi:hypothetical protein